LQAAAEFDLILLDPPYDADPDTVQTVLDAAATHLADEGLIVLERATRHEPRVPPSVQRIRDVKSGDSTLTLFTRR
jgi:16S rRNA G966 N2-methylase RsmD